MPLSSALVRLLPVALAAVLSPMLRADVARFDLVGPRVDVRVTRGMSTLPIAQVPNLQPGDKLWVKADLPSDQSNHLLLIVAFLRGTTNEPPDSWFTAIDTWNRKQTAEGTSVTIPRDAQQALLFIAPATGGDFKTLRSAVKGRPGLFIRADSDLNEASFEQQRIQHYLAAMKNVPDNDPKAIADHTAKLSATLALKPNADCFKQPVDAQVNCLTQSSAPVLLSDGHGQSVAESLSSGPSSDFINAASGTAAAGGGVYSAYVGAVVDLVHLVTTMHTAKYQYIPGLSFPENSTLNLRLNAPVSFVDPKSVIVIGLPAIQKAVPPPLHAHDPNQVACLLQPHMPLLLEGAPLVFSTSFAHDLVLHLNRPQGGQDIPLMPDAFEGGLVVDHALEQRKPLRNPPASGSPAAAAVAGSPGVAPDPSGLTVTGTVHGFWGFDPFDGPTLTLQAMPGSSWRVVGNPQLLAGQQNYVALSGNGTACVQHIGMANSRGDGVNVAFKPAVDDSGKLTRDTLALDLPVNAVQPGATTLAIQQYGSEAHATVQLTAYAGGIQLASLRMHSGDARAVLAGAGLGNVVSVQIADQAFTPAPGGASDTEVRLVAKAGVSPSDGTEAQVKLNDGRLLPVRVSTEAARPRLNLISFTATPSRAGGEFPVTLRAPDAIPLNGRLTFVVETQEAFPRDQKIEVATADGAVRTVLSLADNNLVLQDARTAIATLDPLKAFGASAFGRLQMRPIAADGTRGDWSPLGTLVRAPSITAVHCAAEPAAGCTVEGSELFLVQSFSAAKDGGSTAEVPSGYAQDSIKVPSPRDGTLFLKLRDEPGVTATVAVPRPAARKSAAGAEIHGGGQEAAPAGEKAPEPPSSAAPGTAAGAAPESSPAPAAESPAAPPSPAAPTAAPTPKP